MWITNQSQLIMEPNRKRWRGEEWNLSSGIMTKKAVLIHFQQNEIVDAIQHSLGDSFQLEQVENLDQLEKTENVTCVLALGLSFEVRRNDILKDTEKIQLKEIIFSGCCQD